MTLSFLIKNLMHFEKKHQSADFLKKWLPHTYPILMIRKSKSVLVFRPITVKVYRPIQSPLNNLFHIKTKNKQLYILELKKTMILSIYLKNIIPTGKQQLPSIHHYQLSYRSTRSLLYLNP